MHANISFHGISSKINSTFIEAMFLTTIENVVEQENKTSTSSTHVRVNTIRSGYIFSFVIVFLIVLIGIVSRVIYSSQEPPIEYVYKKYQRALSLPADYRCQIEFLDQKSGIDAIKSKKQEGDNKRNLEDIV